MAWEADFQDYLNDAKLHIETTVRDDTHADDHIHPYEPTSYSVLDRLAESEFIGPDDHLIDYGSGLGRVPIYLFDRVGCHATGVEIVEDFYKKACGNLEHYSVLRDDRIFVGFENVRAQDYVVPETGSCLFFFNPFPISIFRSVMDRVLESFNEKPRRIRLFLYYPSDEYIAFLSSTDWIMFEDEIDCMDLFRERDTRNRIVIFETV